MRTKKGSYLSTTDLCVGYRSKRGEQLLFKDLNLSLDPGRLICFMGPNGSGKSSLIRTLAGLQKPLSGSITLHDPSSDRNAHKMIAVVLTEKVIAANMTAYEVITFGRYPYLSWNINLTEHDHEIIERSIAQVHISQLMDKSLHELSDGQVQMVMIARALAQDTPIILLDEPTAHLDLNNRVEVMRLLQKLSRVTNKAILVATHELDLALQTADWIWLTGKNKDMLIGIPEDLVLNGSFDDVFRFKGFDLRNGKVQHETHRAIKVHVIGEGHVYLWTKNALERNGIEVTDYATNITVRLEHEEGHVRWHLLKDGRNLVTESVEQLLNSI